MKITVKLVGLFRIGRFKEETLECASDSSDNEIIEHLRLPRDVLGIILINGVHADEKDLLKDGDTLSILPLLDGG